MKKYIVLILMLVASNGYGYNNLFFRDAGDITSGILNTTRLDSATITEQGNNFNAPGQLVRLDGNGLVPFSNISPFAGRYFSVSIATIAGKGGDSVGTDQVPWNAAIASITAQGGGSIYVQSGSYTFTASVAPIPRNITIVLDPGVILTNNGNFQIFDVAGNFQGNNAQVIPQNNFTRPFFNIRSSATVQDLNFSTGTVGNESAAVSAGEGLVKFGGAFMATLKGCRFSSLSGGTWQPIYVGTSILCNITGNYFNNIDTTYNRFITIDGSSFTMIRNNVIYDNATAQRLVSFTGTAVYGTRIEGNTMLTTNNNTVGTLLRTESASSATIVTNNMLIVQPAGGSCVGVWFNSLVGDFENEVSNNVFIGCGGAAVQMVGVNDVNTWIHGNHIINGVFTSDAGTGTKFRDNRLSTDAMNTDS